MPPKRKEPQRHSRNRAGTSQAARTKMTRTAPSPAARRVATSTSSVQRGIRSLAQAARASPTSAVEAPGFRRQTKRSRIDHERDDVDEDVTLEQLGRQAYQVAPPVRQELAGAPAPVMPASPAFLLSSSLPNAAATAVVETREGGRGGSSLRGTSTPPPLLTPQRAGTTSPEHLPSRNFRTTPLLSSLGKVDGTRDSPPRQTHIPYVSDDCKNNTTSERGSIALSPAERPSTTLIRKAAATRPAVSPATLWICIDDDDDEEEEIKVISCQLSPAPPALRPEASALPPASACAAAYLGSAAAATAPSTTSATALTPAPLPAGREPIAGVLPPTFRPRKGPLQANKPPPRTLSPLPDGCFIYDDDFTDEDEEGNDEAGAHRGVGNGASRNPPYHPLKTWAKHLDVSTTTQVSFGTLPYHASQSYIIDDDASDSSSSGCAKTQTNNKKSSLDELGEELNHTLDAALEMERVDDDSSAGPLRLPLLPSTDGPNVTAFLQSDASSPVRSVRDFLFSSRRQASADWSNASFSSLTPTVATAARSTATINNSNKNSKTMMGEEELDVEPKRAVERLCPLFEKRFTRKCFCDTVESVVSRLHCLDPGEFWQAFITAEYVGEGSFGIVWRCQTVDGDLVAVKSCPISFHSRGSIDDGFSVLREIAIMRFLNEHEVPYILPLHSAFFVPAREALPPDVVGAVEWKARVAREAEECERRKRLRRRPTRKWQQPLKQSEEEKREARETETHLAERMRYEKVRLPRFLSISVEDAMECDATIFLVTELCDGDLENIERHDSITKGVVFSVSSALSAMHQLGLVHLDLKPSNILFAYENSPSQLQYHSQQWQQQREPSTVGTSASAPSSLSTPPSAGVMRVTNAPTAGSVKFYLSDFGNCRIVGPGLMDEVMGVFGTLEYMDIRALEDKTCSRATDCYSLGATLYELIYSRRLYPPCKNPKCVSEDDHTRHCYIEAARQPVVLEPPPSASSQPMSILQKVMAGLLALEPKERWTAERCRSFFLINSVTGATNTPSK
ncbi:protein kinase [Trypanosoma rangeli SC58]|uniref:Protein kinase n=1 Tax=Trypanosoma rangeli SC58 TaxID=429131 RepID=A0A061ITZ9_TRYRA|nr:protein kinase [Trypanosoma rangeli SC58]